MKKLQELLNEIADLLNLATSKKQAIEMGKKTYLALEFASVYGGYRIIAVDVNNGGHYGALKYSSIESRIPAKLMEIRLNAIINGIELQKNLN